MILKATYRHGNVSFKAIVTRLGLWVILLMSMIGVLNTYSYAQYGGYAGAGVQIGFDATNSSLGNTGTAGWVSDSLLQGKRIYGPTLSSNPYFNPALVASTRDAVHVNLSLFELGFDRQYQSIGAQIPLPPKAGLFIGLIRSGVNDIDSRSLSGYPLGSIQTNDLQLQSAFGIRLSERAHAGIGFKINRYDLHEDLKASTSVGVDIGLLFKLTKTGFLAISIQDLLAEHTWNSGDLYNLSQSANRVEQLPTRFKVGYSTLAWDTQIATEYEIRQESSDITIRDIFSSGSSRTQYIEQKETRMTNSQFFRAGLSRSLHASFRLNLGYQHTLGSDYQGATISSGFSIQPPQMESFTIDYAFARNTTSLGSMHIFTLRYIL